MGSAASSADCLPATFVSIAVQVQASPSVASHPAILQVVSSVASVDVGHVVLVRATAEEGNSTLVEIRIAAGEVTQANEVCKRLEKTKMNLAVGRPDLPVCLLLLCALDLQPLGTWNEILTLVMIGAAVSVTLCTICITVFYRRQNKQESEMSQATRALRRRLRIEQGDGYFLDSDWRYPWQKIINAVHLPKNCVESATKLSLLRDFNPLDFDVFCICLVQPSHQHAGRSVQHVALYDWNLEMGTWLLQPSLKVDKSAINPETGREWTERERFAFLQKLCKCQVR